MAQGPYAPSKQTRLLWGIFFGVIVTAYSVAFVAVIVRAAGFGGGPSQITPVPGTVVASGALSPANATATAIGARDIATPAPTATPITPPTPPPTPTATPVRPTDTPTPSPDIDFRVPLSASNTGVIHGYEVSILGISDNATGTGTRAKAGNKYIAIEVSIANQTANPMPQGAWLIETTAGQDYDISRSTVVGTPLPAAQLQGSARVSGFVVFEVPANAKLKWIRFHAPQFPQGDLFFDA
jgi:hypothetical protein